MIIKGDLIVIKRDNRVEAFDIKKLRIFIWDMMLELKDMNYDLLEKIMAIIEKKVKKLKKERIIYSSNIIDILFDIFRKEDMEDYAEALTVFLTQKNIIKNKKIPAWANLGVPYSAIFDMSVIVGINKCLTLNELVEIGRDENRIRELIENFSKWYLTQVRIAASKAAEKIRHGARVVIIAGPSSSGKTTTTLWLSKILREEFKIDFNFFPLHVDDYFKNGDEYPIDEFGDPDYESPEALRIPLINEQLKQLLDGKEIDKPIYDFKTSNCTGTEKVRLDEKSIILIDCLHGLTPDLTNSVSDDLKCKIFIECMPVLLYDSFYNSPLEFRRQFVRWTDWRTMRRTCRDNLSRGTTPYHTFGHWHYVRKWELRSLIPFIIDVDSIINSYFPAEIFYFKANIYQYLPEIVKGLRKQKRIDGLRRAMRVKELLEKVPPVTNLDLIPKDNLMLEFISPKLQKIT
ncbi:ATP cone domain-containing protein [Candidatus Riflebacteria bacterium]